MCACVCDEHIILVSLQMLWAFTRWDAINNLLLLFYKVVGGLHASHDTE